MKWRVFYRDGQRVWYRRNGQWYPGTVVRPTGPDMRSYLVAVDGDPLRVIEVEPGDLTKYRSRW